MTGDNDRPDRALDGSAPDDAEPRSEPWEGMETEAEAIRRLRSAGFSDDFRLDADGRIRSDDDDWAPKALKIVELVRFEGMSNPSDESMVLAIETPDQRCGTLVLPYGPEMTAEQVDASRDLMLNRPKPRGHE